MHFINRLQCPFLPRIHGDVMIRVPLFQPSNYCPPSTSSNYRAELRATRLQSGHVPLALLPQGLQRLWLVQIRSEETNRWVFGEGDVQVGRMES